MFELNFSKEPLESVIERLSKNTLPEWMQSHYNFLKSYNNYNEFEIETSGTTGTPKIILVTKMQMQLSATATLSYFNLNTGMSTMLCLSSNFIAAIENRQGFKIGCIEEIAFQNKWINKSHIKKAISFYGNCDYSRYLNFLLKN